MKTQFFPKRRLHLLNKGGFTLIELLVVIAIIAIGMTMVIITAGIDLSVGSLVALSAVVVAWCITHWFGGLAASGIGLLAAALMAIVIHIRQISCNLFI